MCTKQQQFELCVQFKKYRELYTQYDYCATCTKTASIFCAKSNEKPLKNRLTNINDCIIIILVNDTYHFAKRSTRIMKYTVYIMSKNETKTNKVITLTDLMKVVNATQTATETFDKVLKSNESTKYVGVPHFTIVGFNKSSATCYCNTTVANALVNANLIDEKSITRDRKCSDNTDYKVDKNSGVKYEVRPHMFKVTSDLKTFTALIKTALTALATATK